MIDGDVNSVSALAWAGIKFAMDATGTDTTIRTTDVMPMGDDLRRLPVFIRLPRFTVGVLKQNTALALDIKTAFSTLTFAGQVIIRMAVLANMDASLLVVGNGLRLLRR